MDFGKFFQDAGKNLGNFFNGNYTNRESDEEKRRKAEEARQRKAEQERQRQLQQQQQKTVQPIQNPMDSLSVPTVSKQPVRETPQQTSRPTADNPFGINDKPKKVEPPKVEKSEAEQIQGYYVMSPAAQKAAVDKLRAQGGTPEQRREKAKEALKAGDVKQVSRILGSDIDTFKQLQTEVAAEKKAGAEQTAKDWGGVPLVGTALNWGAGLAAMTGKATGNKELEDRANNQRNLYSLGMNTEEIEQYDQETQDKFKVLQNIVTGLGVLDGVGAASLVKAPIIGGVKNAAKEGFKSEAGRQILDESVRQTLKQYRNNVVAGVAVGGVADPAIQAYIKDGEVDWSSVPSSMLQGGLWAAALPEFSGKAKLVQKMQANDVLTPEESKQLNAALREAEGKDVPEQNSFAPLDEPTVTKTSDLRVESDKTPQPDGTTRLYQMTEGDIASPNYFDNIEQLANYINGRSQNGTVRFVDVPTERVQPVVGAKGEAGVFEIKPDEASLEGVQRMMTRVDESQEPITDVQAQAAQQAEGGSDRGISYEEVMQNLRERNRVYNEADPQTKAEIDSRAAAQANPDDVTTQTPYSREAVFADLQAAGLSTADITTLTQRYNLTAQEWRTLLNASGDLSGARNVAAVLDSQARKILNRQPVGQVVDTPQGRTDTTTGEIVDEVPPVDAPRTTSVFENDIQEIRDYMGNVLRLADETLQESGSSWEQLSRKIQMADRNNTAPELTDIEARTYQIIREQLDNVLVKAQDSGRAGETGNREWYLPQARQGSTQLPETMEDIYNTGFGFDQRRQNAVELEDLDYGFNPVVDYVVKGSAQENIRKQTIFQNYQEYAPNAPVEKLEEATELRYANDQNINKLTDDPKANPDDIDTVGTAAKVAETLGIQRVDNNAKLSRGLNVKDTLDNAGVLNSGFNQYRRAQALSQNFESPEQLFESIRKSPAENGLALTDITRERATKIVDRLRANLDKAETPEQSQALMSNAVRALAKANVDEMLLKTNFTDPKLAKLVNSEYNRMAIGFNKATTVSDKVAMGLRRIMNASMRGFNLNSALTELTDVVNAMSMYGGAAWKNLNPAGANAVLERWGQSGIVARMDNPDKAVEVFDALSRGDKGALKRISQAADSVEEKLALYRYAENYKAALFLKSAEDYWAQVDPNLQGTALTGRILDEFDRNMIPLDHFTRVFSSDNQGIKLMTQYLDWNILNTRQQARNLVGANDSGIYRDMSRGSRIARNMAVNLVPRVGIGLARGVPVITTIGIIDPLGLASQDFSGVQDKNTLDEIMEVAGVSPILSLMTSAYFNYRQDEITAENYEGETPPEDDRGNWIERTGRNFQKMFTPYGGQIGSYDQLLRNFGVDFGGEANGRGTQAMELMEDGYSDNKNGRVQYLAPDNIPDQIRAWVMGKGQTQEGREYSGTPDIFSVMAGEASLADLWNSNATMETLSNSQGDYIRPVTDNDFTIGMDGEGNAMTANFNTMIKNAETREEKQAILAQAREYNAVLDDFRRDDPQAAEAYDQIMSNDDLVSPEYWKEITGTNSDGSINLDIYKMIGERKKQLAKSLGAPYDPMYDLPDDQARSLLQLKGTATGDDIALRNILYKSDWYNQYSADRSAYYDLLPEQTDEEGRQTTERVKQWNAYDKQLNSLSTLNSPELMQQFPYNAAYKEAERQFEAQTGNEFFGSAESDAWWSQYGAGKKAEDAALDSAKLEVINQMRVIEGFPPMTPDQYAQATEIASTGGGSGGGGGGGSFEFIPEFFSEFKATRAPDVKRKAPAFNPNTSVGRRSNTRKSLGARSSGGDQYRV